MATGLVQQEGNCHVKLSWLFVYPLLAASLCQESLVLLYLFPLLKAVIVSGGGFG